MAPCKIYVLLTLTKDSIIKDWTKDITLLAQIKKHEGLRTKPYRCSSGKLTIGIGRNLDDNGITEVEAMMLYDSDIQLIVQQLNKALPWWTTLSGKRQKVLIDMVFNMGINRFLGFKKMLKHLKAGEYKQASNEMLASVWATQVGTRALTLHKMMRGE